MEKKIYQAEEYGFPCDKIDSDALYVIQKLQNAGHAAYLVGGSVRDLLLNKTPKDFDIATSAPPEEIKKNFRNCILIGRRFRLAHVRFGKKVLEVSTFRSGDISSESLILRDNEWGNPEEDALRRDFTINGLFYDPSNQTIIDYVGGLFDLKKGLLRTIGQPHPRFKQDPVRMLRLLKFQARFGFEIEEETKIALSECKEEITKSSAARILEEIFRMLESGAAKSFFDLITHHGLLRQMFPLLSDFFETHQGKETYDYLEEIDTKYRESNLLPIDRAVLLACVTFPCFAHQIEKHFLAREKIPHLGEIQQEASVLIDDLFPPLFRLPRRIKWVLAFILTSQYRLTPLDKKKSHRLRVPKDPDFLLALRFLEIRAAIEPGLQTLWQQWQEAIQYPDRQIPSTRQRRRRHPKRT